MNGCALERFLERERRKDARETAGKHCLAGAGRTDKQKVVTSRGGDFESTPRKELPTDIGQISVARGGRHLGR